MLLTRWERTTDALCSSCGVEHGHALDCAAWWDDYRRDHFDDQRVAWYRRVAWVVMAVALGAWISGANVAAAGLLAVTITLIGFAVHERRKPIA
jgi:hypothetical protein